MESLELLMSGLAKTNGPRDPLELFAAIDATLNSPALKNNTEATALLAHTVPTIHDSRYRAIVAHTLGRRGANAALIALLRHDPSAGVRTAATEALAQSSAPFDDAILFEVARNDKMPAFVQKHGLPSNTSIGCMTGPIGLSLSMRRATALR